MSHFCHQCQRCTPIYLDYDESENLLFFVVPNIPYLLSVKNKLLRNFVDAAALLLPRLSSFDFHKCLFSAIAPRCIQAVWLTNVKCVSLGTCPALADIQRFLVLHSHCSRVSNELMMRVYLFRLRCVYHFRYRMNLLRLRKYLSFLFYFTFRRNLLLSHVQKIMRKKEKERRAVRMSENKNLIVCLRRLRRTSSKCNNTKIKWRLLLIVSTVA